MLETIAISVVLVFLVGPSLKFGLMTIVDAINSCQDSEDSDPEGGGNRPFLLDSRTVFMYTVGHEKPLRRKKDLQGISNPSHVGSNPAGVTISTEENTT